MKILFKLSPNKFNQGVYQHNIICLAEGFRKMGLEFYGNIDYWYEEKVEAPLIKVQLDNFEPDIIIYSSHFIRDNFTLEIKTLSNFFSVLIDSEDGFVTVSDLYAKHFNLVLRSHFNSTREYASNVYPWSFGLSERMIKAVEMNQCRCIKDRIFINYRVFYNGRHLARKFLDPILKVRFVLFNEITDPYSSEVLKIRDMKNIQNSYWWQTGCRHDNRYYSLLNESRFTYSFGGPLVLKLPFLITSSYLLKFNRRMTQLLLDYGLLRSSFVINYQFDSWRFWEAMLSNSIPLHFDFESWNFVLPVMPINGTHYYGVHNLDFKGCGDKILSISSSDLNQISVDGAKWALEHYSPLAVSTRLIRMINVS